MLSGEEMLRRDAREVGDVLGEQRTPVRDRRRKYLRVRAPGDSELNDGAGVDTGRSQRIGQAGRVHLVQQQLQRVSAAAVS
jgi:hypothetical protein